jgi:hypothetical protein
VNGERKEFPPPVLGKDYNFVNGSCMLYEANHVRECLRKGEEGRRAALGLHLRGLLCSSLP